MGELSELGGRRIVAPEQAVFCEATLPSQGAKYAVIKGMTDIRSTRKVLLLRGFQSIKCTVDSRLCGVIDVVQFYKTNIVYPPKLDRLTAVQKVSNPTIIIPRHINK